MKKRYSICFERSRFNIVTVESDDDDSAINLADEIMQAREKQYDPDLTLDEKNEIKNKLRMGKIADVDGFYWLTRVFDEPISESAIDDASPLVDYLESKVN